MTRARLLSILLLALVPVVIPAPAHATSSFIVDADVADNGGATAL